MGGTQPIEIYEDHAAVFLYGSIAVEWGQGHRVAFHIHALMKCALGPQAE
jgi:hypothetical protein